jgi:hypothetical protein
MIFTPTSSNLDLNRTSNISYLIDDDQQFEMMDTITVDWMESKFGQRAAIDMPSDGYEVPEWYFKTDTGYIFGIGFRWGTPRLRGKGPSIPGQAISHPSKIAARDFMDFVLSPAS